MSQPFQPPATHPGGGARGPNSAAQIHPGAVARGSAEAHLGMAPAEGIEHDAEGDVPAQLRGTLVSQAIPRVEGQAYPESPQGLQSRFQLGPAPVGPAPVGPASARMEPIAPSRPTQSMRPAARSGQSPPATTVLDTAQLGAVRRLIAEKRGEGMGRPSIPMEAHSESVRVDTDPGVITHSKLKAPAAAQWTPGPELQHILLALAQSDLGAVGERLLPPGLGNPFEGLMNETLELRVTPEMLDRAASRTAPERDQVWLGPAEPSGQMFINSFGYSDDAVALAFKNLYYEERDVSSEVLPILGQLGKLESQVVDVLSVLGLLALRLEKHLQLLPMGAPESHELRSILDDPEISSAMTAQVKQLHPPKFWQDDDGSGQKAIRLIGYQLYRKKGELLRQLPDRLASTYPEILAIREKAAKLQAILQERTALIRRHIGSNQPPGLGSSFLAQRGLNAAPGFFWLEPLPEGSG